MQMATCRTMLSSSGRHLFLSLKLTFPFLFNLHDVQSTLDFKQAEKIHNRRGKELNPDRWLHLAVSDIH